MSVETLSPKAVQAAVQAAVDKYGRAHDALVPILSEVNHTLGYLPVEALEAVRKVLREPSSRMEAVATFYSMLSTHPRGRHVIQFCESAPCHVVGGREVWQAVQNVVPLQPGETSADGRWTLITTSCLGLCAVGPLLVVDTDVYGNVEARRVPDILARYA